EDGIRDFHVTGVQTCALPIFDNLSHAGAPGYQVLTVLELAEGSHLLVNRGWVPFSGFREQLPPVALPEGTAGMPIELTGRIAGQIGRASCRERSEMSAMVALS